MYYCGFFLAAALLGGCKGDALSTSPSPLPPTRVIATVYATHATTNAIACQREPKAESASLLVLKRDEQVELVSVHEHLIRQGQQYWVHVHPRQQPQQSCYIRADQLIPLS